MKHLIAIGLMCFFNQLTAQRETLKPTLIDNTDPTRWLYIAPAVKPGLVGDQYLFGDWQTANIVFRENVIKEDLLVNYNLEDEELEIATSDGIKILPEGLILSWTTNNKSFRSLFDLDNDCLPKGKKYAQVLFDSDNTILFRVTDIKKRNPSYNEKLGIGDNNYRYIKSDRLLLIKNSRCEEIIGSNSKREKLFIDFFGNRHVTKIISEQKLDMKSDDHIIKLLEQLSNSTLQK